MKEIVCIGTESFTLGFRLTGIRNAIIANTKQDFLYQIDKIRQNPHIGVVIVDEQLLLMLEIHERSRIEDSPDPVFISLSTQSSSDNLRKLIIRSIGVDILKGE